MIKVLLALPSLEDLGVQHDVRTLMQYWDKERFDVKMLLHSRTGNFAKKFSSDMRSVQVDDYSSNLPKFRVLSRLNAYKKLISIEKPDAIISFVPFSNYGCAWAKFVGQHKFGLAISEHAHVTAAMSDPQNMGNLFMKFYRRSFKFVYNSKVVDVVKCIAEESRQDLLHEHKINPDRLDLIHNPVPMDEIIKLSQEKVDHPWFQSGNKVPLLINVGRLCYQKQQDKLLLAFAKVKKVIDCKLVLVGSGEQKTLKKLAADLDIEDDIYFVGFDSNPWKWMVKSDLFVLSSMWEGLPCVLTEAMVLGTPIVSTKCPSGPTEMLLDGKAGYLSAVDDIDELADNMLYALQNKNETKMKAQIAKDHLKRFEPSRVVRQYEDLAIKLSELSKN